MTVEVITYNHPQYWENHSSFDYIKNEIHITATQNVKEGICERYKSNKGNEFKYIFTIHELISKVFADWYNPTKQLEQYLTLSKVINNLDGDLLLKEAFKNNTSDVLETIRLLIFSGLSPSSFESLRNLTKKESFFIKLWQQYETIDKSCKELRKRLNGTWNKLDISLYIDKNNILDILNKKIILHGFYFITPEQQVFLKILERSGFELIFFHYYDLRFEKTFNFTKSFISSKFDWPDPNDWKYVNNYILKNDTLGAKFLSSFEGGYQKKLPQHHLKIVPYDSFYDFLQGVIMKNYPIRSNREYIQNVSIIATNADILNDVLVQYYPEKYADRRNFLNYPIGQFILKIHDMWDKGRLIFNSEILLSVFSSGWLNDGRENARDYTHDLNQILSFFNRCKYVEQWIGNIDLLLMQYNDILPLFENNADNRVLESIRSPFTKISYLSIDKDRICQIKKFLIIMIEMAKDLFDLSKNETSITLHFDRLSKLINKHNPINKIILQKEEIQLIEKINQKFVHANSDLDFLYEDISKAISFYLSGRFSKDEPNYLITPFIEIDGEVFKNSKKKIYLTGLDEKGLPLSEFMTPWPFQDETFKELSNFYPVLKLFELRNKSVKPISRYLLFMAIEFLNIDNLELSWIKNFLDRKNLQPAVYVHYLNLKIDKDFIFSDESQEMNNFPDDFLKITPDEVLLQSAIEDLKYEDILAEYEICPRRFYYGYILDRFPTFSSDFIHQFLFSEIIKIFKRFTGKENEYVINTVSKLFPQWTKFKKENIARESLEKSGKNRGRMELISGAQITEYRRNFQFPGITNIKRNEIYNNVIINKEDYLHYIKNPKSEFEYIMEAKPAYECRYCPFLDICPEGSYSVDERKH